MSLQLDFSLRQGTFALTLHQSLAATGLTAVFGPSGAGKSTLLRVIAGFQPSGGSIRFGNEHWEGAGTFIPPHRRKVGFVFQDARLFAHLDVSGNLVFAAKRAGTMSEIPAMVTRFELSTLLTRNPAQLSGGEAQRVALARALLSAPRLLLMDEPLSALDAARRSEILPHIERLRDEALLPILYVSHSLPEVVRLANDALVLSEGRVSAFGTVGQVFSGIDKEQAMGNAEPATMIETRLAEHETDGLCRLNFAGGDLWVPALPQAIGSTVRLLVAARDVMIARTRPEGISALNILPATVLSLTSFGSGVVMVRLNCASTTLVAQITARSVMTLGLESGKECYAILKSVALVRD